MCIFCDIVEKKIPSKIIYEDGEILAFLDIKPLNKGHTLVIPKKHYRWIWDIQNLGNFYEKVGKIVNAMKNAVETDYIVSLVFGEEVEHAHVHLIPRYKGDGHGGDIKLDNLKNISKEENDDVIEKIKKNFD